MPDGGGDEAQARLESAVARLESALERQGDSPAARPGERERVQRLAAEATQRVDAAIAAVRAALAG